MDHMSMSKGLKMLLAVTLVVLILPVLAYYFVFIPKNESNKLMVLEQKEETLPNQSVLISSEGVEVVRANCTSCHSAHLIVQNRATREGWESMIRWMQRTQNLWQLGANETIILDYLSENYAPEEKGRRTPLDNIEWYELKEYE